MPVDDLYKQEYNIQDIANLPRFASLLQKAIDKLELDLRGLVVLTEAASGNYMCTPIIAAMSGAKKVYAYARDSRYGTAKEIFQNTKKFAWILRVEDKIEFSQTLDAGRIGKADMVTNLGPLRPIRKEFIDKMKDTAVIPLMREPWELREGEIDLRACKNRGIVVLGTNENHPLLVIYDYLGHLCAKKLFEMGIEILTSKIIVFGGGEFGLNIIKYLVRLGADVKGICDEDANVIEDLGAEKIGDLVDDGFDLEAMKNADALIITTYPNDIEVIGDKGLISAKKLKNICPGVSVIQFKGNVDRNSVRRERIPILPEKAPLYGHMSWTLSDLGLKTVIDLHTAGLKVGEIAVRLRLEGNSPEEATAKASEHGLVKNFDEV